MLKSFPAFSSATLLMLAWLIPNHYPPWSAYYSELFAVIALFALAAVVLLYRYPLTFPRAASFVFLLALVPLLQFASDLIYFLGDALSAGFYLATFGFAIVIGANLAKNSGPRFAETLAWVCLIGALISVVLALHQWLELQQLGIWLMDMRPGGRPYANLAQPNNLATLLCIGLTSALYLRERGYFGRIVLTLLSFLLLVGVAMTRSRTAFLIMLAIAVWILWGRKKFGLNCSPIEVAAALGMFVLLWTGWATISEYLYLTADSTTARLGTFDGEIRLVLWQQMIDALAHQPWFGYGWNQVGVAQISVVTDHPNMVWTEYAHNLVLDVLIWNGVLLGSAILAAMGWWLITRMRRVNSLESWFALLIILVVCTHSLFEYPHAYAYFLLLVGLCIGIVDLSPASPAPRLPHWTFAMATVIGSALLLWTIVEYQRIEVDYRLMRFENAGIEREKPKTLAPNVVILTQMRELIRFVRTQAKEEMTAAELDWMRRVAHRYAHPSALFRYALALGLNNRPQEAGLELERLKRLYTTHFSEIRPAWDTLTKEHPQLEQVVFPLQ